jgi:DtxR family Mn-dependent transcriptional regulator
MNTADQSLKAIYMLQQASDSPASKGDIADRLGVSPASANEMIGKLAKRGLTGLRELRRFVNATSSRIDDFW